MIVSDAGPIISFARAGRLDLLARVVGQLVIPEAVYTEVVVNGTGKPGAVDVACATWVRRQPVGDPSSLQALPLTLGAGEAEALALAQETGAYLLVDDPAARRVAKAKGIALISTLDVIDEAKDCGVVAEAKPILDELIFHGYRLKRSLYEAKLLRAGE